MASFIKGQVKQACFNLYAKRGPFFKVMHFKVIITALVMYANLYLPEVWPLEFCFLSSALGEEAPPPMTDDELPMIS